VIFEAPAACFATEINGNLRGSIVQTVVTSNVTLKQPERRLHADPNVILMPSVVTLSPNNYRLGDRYLARRWTVRKLQEAGQIAPF
jgi:hypothetical protein